MAENKDKKVLNVPALRFPEFTDKWKKGYFKDVCKITTGNKNTQDKDENGLYPFYVRSQNIERINSWTFDGEAILTAGDGVGVGKVFHYSIGKIGVHQRVYILSDFKCDGKYLYQYFSSRFYNRVKRMSAKNSVDSVRMEMIADMPLYLPSVGEQHKIGKLLALLDERISTQNKIIEDLKKLKSAITDLLFHSIADAHTIRLGEIAHITNGAGDVQDANTEHQEDWYPFFDRSEELKWFPTYSFDKEAVIYAGEGQSFYPRYYNGKFALHQRCYAITDFASCIIPKYCYHFMNTLNSYFVRNSVGSTVPSLRMDIFQKVEIRLPPIPKQQHICKIIDAFYTKLEVEQRGISILQELKQFLLSQMFI